MPSHLNAHNIPPPRNPGRAALRAGHDRFVLPVFGILFFLLVSRLSVRIVPPHYRAIPDSSYYHTLYYSEKFQHLRRIGGQLETVILGDSRTRHGVDPSLFTGQAPTTPVTAYNLASASSGIAFTDLVVREYLIGAPRLRTLVWGVSPRIFNRYWNDPVLEAFRESRGYKADRRARQAGWTRRGIACAAQTGLDRMFEAVSGVYAHRTRIRSIVLDRLDGTAKANRFHEEPPIPMNAWGFMQFPAARTRDVSNAEESEEVLASMEHGRFEMDDERLMMFRELVALLAEHEIRLVCFIPPMHHELAAHPAADFDGTPDADYERLVSVLHDLQERHPNYRFADLHGGGRNGYGDEDYADFDHLNEKGARKLSRALSAIIADAWDVTRAESPGADVSVVSAEREGPHAVHPQSVTPRRRTPVGGDSEPPSVRTHLGDLDYMVGAFPPDNRPEIWAAYTDAGSGIDVETVRLLLNGKDITDESDVGAGRIVFKPAQTLPSPEFYTFTVIVCDRAGNRTEVSWEILLKPC
ncbi:hypothetical protein ACFLSJ_08315 [Verrucomicrobiota bacterium]